MAKASGCLLRWRDRLLLLTNWHVVSGKRWMSASERQRDRGPQVQWLSTQNSYSPDHLKISVWLEHSRHPLRTLALRSDPSPEDELDVPRLAWEPEDFLLRGQDDMPSWDLVCLEVARDLEAQEERLSIMFDRRVRLGYDVAEVGRAYGLAAAHQVFVVGYPSTIGTREQDPPVWTSGSIATDPSKAWDGPRFLIDSRTREGQSGSGVITYEPAGRGLPARQQLVGIYSGRIETSADIGSVWPLEGLLESLCRRSPIVERFPLPESMSGPALLL